MTTGHSEETVGAGSSHVGREEPPRLENQPATAEEEWGAYHVERRITRDRRGRQVSGCVFELHREDGNERLSVQMVGPSSIGQIVPGHRYRNVVGEERHGLIHATVIRDVITDSLVRCDERRPRRIKESDRWEGEASDIKLVMEDNGLGVPVYVCDFTLKDRREDKLAVEMAGTRWDGQIVLGNSYVVHGAKSKDGLFLAAKAEDLRTGAMVRAGYSWWDRSRLVIAIVFVAIFIAFFAFVAYQFVGDFAGDLNVP